MTEHQHRVVIIGAGFGGLYAAKALRRAPVRVTVLDRRNFHLFQPLLYQVATGALSPGEIASPIRFVLRKSRNTEVLLGEAMDFDADNRRVILRDGEIGYDTLIVATGAHHHYFGNDQWAAIAPGLKSVEDAIEMRRRILLAFEEAEREPDAEKRRAWLTFVVVGAGATGVELAGALGEIANDTLKQDFRHINPREASILLVEGTDRVLPTYPSDLSSSAEQQLISLGVRTLTRTKVTVVDAEGVILADASGQRRIPARTVLWAAGVQASVLGRALAARTGAPLDRAGRLVVEPDLSVPGRPEIIVIGDLASFSHQTGQPLSGVAPVAMQQGRYAAELVRKRLEGGTLPPFHYRDKGSLATIGRAAAVADFGRIRFGGFFAWLAWLFIHLLYLVEFDNRLLVLTEWTYNYITRNRGARLITSERYSGNG